MTTSNSTVRSFGAHGPREATSPGLSAHTFARRSRRCPGRPSHIQAAVDRPDLAGDIGGLVGRQEADDAGDLRRPAHPANRNLPPDPIEPLARAPPHHVSADEPPGHPPPPPPHPVA